ncbi:hypothetical protein CROQUDRAFT_660843 [Cronartium quercuum f. sp. fusiforme G11]|uniref:Uncharacterized protein n=1 Tax=Cronartium quercuum f. sp. fusiforme G11 TaxID=708437 RepID=A0A9P6T9N0_9BASI|nr:hypothetical protein CROQUDRAFT_660843 [Cronartium quercuum f. sp. fusiforme G11]
MNYSVRKASPQTSKHVASGGLLTLYHYHLQLRSDCGYASNSFSSFTLTTFTKTSTTFLAPRNPHAAQPLSFDPRKPIRITREPIGRVQREKKRGLPTEDDATGDKMMTKASPVDHHRPDKMTMPRLWKKLVANMRKDGDVVIPSKLVDIMSALVYSIEDTSNCVSAIEDRLRASNEALERLDMIESQLRNITMNGPLHTTQPELTHGLPPRPRSWAAAATQGQTSAVIRTHTAP